MIRRQRSNPTDSSTLLQLRGLRGSNIGLITIPLRAFVACRSFAAAGFAKPIQLPHPTIGNTDRTGIKIANTDLESAGAQPVCQLVVDSLVQ